MIKKVFLRTIAGLLLLITAFTMPWWFVFTLGFLFLFLFDFYIESIITAWIIDLLYSGSAWFLGVYIFTVIMAIVFVAVEFLKKRIVY